MNVIQFSATVNTSNPPLQISALPEVVAAAAQGLIFGDLATKMFVQADAGNTGNIFVGTSAMGNDGSDNIPPTLTPGSPTTEAGGFWPLEDQSNRNSIDLTQYYVTGDQNGDIIKGVIHVN